jgi:hypothetical protein
VSARTELALERLLLCYEEARRRHGLGERAALTPSQRIDAATLWLAMAPEGRMTLPIERIRDRLAPVLCDTRDSLMAFSEAVDAWAPKQVGRDGNPPEDPSWCQRLKAFLDRNDVVRLAAFAVAAVVMGAVIVLLPRGLEPVPVEPSTNFPGSTGGGWREPPDPPPDVRTIGDDYRTGLATVMAVLEQYADNLTPRELARTLVGADPALGAPAPLLIELLRLFPLPADQPLSGNGGAAFLRHAAMVVAAVRTGRDLSEFDLRIDLSAETTDGPHREKLRAFSAETRLPPARPYVVERWSRRWELLALAPLLPGLVWAFWPRRRLREEIYREAARDALRRRGRREVRFSVEALEGAPEASRPTRRLMRHREPRSGFALDAGRSVARALAEPDDDLLVMRPASRSIEYLFVVCRRSPADLEAARVLRLVDAFAAAGAPLSVCDYLLDPTRLREPSTGRLFDPRGLAERHGDAVLVLVTDGRELADYGSARPHPVLGSDLQLFSRRIVLSPRPVESWGLDEFRLALALDAPMARATARGLGDIALALDRHALAGSLAGLNASRAAGRVPVEKAAAWREATAALLASGPEQAIPDVLLGRDAELIADQPPTLDHSMQIMRGIAAWLGPRGFLWFAAAAWHPYLRMDTLIDLGRRLHVAGNPRRPVVFDEALLARLTVLPWFRAGRVPPWLRRALYHELTEGERAAAQAAFDNMIAADERRAREGMNASRLPAWYPDLGRETIPEDAVILTERLRENRKEDAEALELIRRENRRERLRLFGGAGLRIAASAVAALALWWAWPDAAAAPHPNGAWLPAIATGMGLVAAALLWWLVGARLATGVARAAHRAVASARNAVGGGTRGGSTSPWPDTKASTGQTRMRWAVVAGCCLLGGWLAWRGAPFDNLLPFARLSGTLVAQDTVSFKERSVGIDLTSPAMVSAFWQPGEFVSGLRSDGGQYMTAARSRPHFSHFRLFQFGEAGVAARALAVGNAANSENWTLQGRVADAGIYGIYREVDRFDDDELRATYRDSMRERVPAAIVADSLSPDGATSGRASPVDVDRDTRSRTPSRTMLSYRPNIESANNLERLMTGISEQLTDAPVSRLVRNLFPANLDEWISFADTAGNVYITNRRDRSPAKRLLLFGAASAVAAGHGLWAFASPNRTIIRLGVDSRPEEALAKAVAITVPPPVAALPARASTFAADSLRISGDGQAGLIRELSGAILLWRIRAEGDTVAQRIVFADETGRRLSVTAAAMAKDGRSFVVATDDGLIRRKAFTGASPGPERILRGHGDVVNLVSLSPGGTRILTASLDGRVIFTDLAQDDRLRVLPFYLWPSGPRETPAMPPIPAVQSPLRENQSGQQGKGPPEEPKTADGATPTTAIVFGTDDSAEAAAFEVARALKAGNESVGVIERPNTTGTRKFHPAAFFETRALAEASLPKLRGLSRYSSGAFIVDMSGFCPGGVGFNSVVLPPTTRCEINAPARAN